MHSLSRSIAILAMLTGCHLPSAPAARVEARTPAPRAAPRNGTFMYEATYREGPFVHTYVDFEGHRIAVRSDEATPSETDRALHVRYREDGARSEHLAPIAGGPASNVAIAGDVDSFDAIPIETAELHRVASYLPHCANVDIWVNVYESDDGSVRLTLPSHVRASERMNVRFRRVPPYHAHIVTFACSGSGAVDVEITAVAVDTLPR